MKSCIISRLLSLLLAVLTVISLAACSSPAQSESPDETTDTLITPDETNSPSKDNKPSKKPSGSTTPSVVPTTTVASLAPRISYGKPAIPANVGSVIQLGVYGVEFTPNAVTDATKLTWSSEAIEIVEDRVSPTEKGIYTLHVTDGENERDVYLVVKDPDESEYLLYYNDFEDSTDLAGLTKISSSGSAAATVENGRLLLDASASGGNDSIRYLLPEWLAEFGDYTVTATATIDKKANESRWMSLMYRVQDSDYPYYQLCVRANTNASNGVELAYRTASSTWEYHLKTAYSSALSPDSLYELTLDVSGVNADVYIDGNWVGGGSGISDYRAGAIGLQASGCRAVYDDIKVTLSFERETNVNLAPTVIAEVSSEESLSAMAKISPDVALMQLSADGNVYAPNGQLIGSANDTVKMLDLKTIPAFILPDAAESDLDGIATLLGSIARESVMIVSSDRELIRALRNAVPSLIGVMDLTSIDLEDRLIEARSEANKAGARICLLSSELATPQNTAFLNSLNMSVWFRAELEPEANDVTEALRLIISGANGIVTDDPELIYECMSSSVFAPNSIIRPIEIIGHRGMPSQAPENTLEGSFLAANYGASIIENDIYITTDDVIVVMHDSTIDRTTNGTGNVEDMFYEQLCEYYVDDKPDDSTHLDGRVNEAQGIPTLEKYLMYFKDTDTFLFIEIKSSKTDRLVPALKALLDKYDFYDQCAVICFSESVIEAVKRDIPELSAGWLNSTPNINTILDTTSKCEASYNPSYSCLSYSLIKKLSVRGILSWPWTVNDAKVFDSLYLCGAAGITTNYANYAKDYYRHLYTDKSEYSFSAGESIEIDISAELYGASDHGDYTFQNKLVDVNNAEMVIVSTNTDLDFDGKKLTSTKSGTADVVFRAPFKLNNGTIAYVYTQPITVTVG